MVPDKYKMNIPRDIKPIAYLKANAVELLKGIDETRRPVLITQNGTPRAVLQDHESYKNFQNAIGVLKLVSQGEEDVKSGKSKAQQDVLA
jgi:prevent-host-death family protein